MCMKGLTKHTLCGIVLFKLNTFLVMFLHVPSIDSMCFFTYVGFIGDHFFLLSTDSTYSRVPGDKGGLIFSDMVFLALVLCTKGCTRICITCPISCKFERIKCVCIDSVLVLVQIDLIQFENLNCIRSI
jgi:hypothetical protein